MSEGKLHVGNLDPAVDEALLYELMLQVAPVKSVYIPRQTRGRAAQLSHRFGFVEFGSAEDAQYAARVLAKTRLFGRQLRFSSEITSTSDRPKAFEARLFVGNLDQDLVDDAALALPFEAFGNVLSAQVVRDNDQKSRGYGFVVFDTFESADRALAAMDQQYLMNRPARVSYAYKEGTTEVHGNTAERKLASSVRT